MESKIQKEIQKLVDANHLEVQKRAFGQEKFRAQSITIGKAGFGPTEIILRASDGEYLFYILQPVEVIEILEQLAANVGCTVQIEPRKDFASYREWAGEEKKPAPTIGVKLTDVSKKALEKQAKSAEGGK